MQQTIPFNVILAQILEVMQLPKDASDKLIKTYDQLSFQRFVRVLLDTLVEDTHKEVATEILRLAQEHELRDEDIEQFTAVIATVIPLDQQAGMYLAAKTTVLVELTEPLLTTATPAEQAAIGTIIADHKEFTQLLKPFLKKEEPPTS